MKARYLLCQNRIDLDYPLILRTKPPFLTGSVVFFATSMQYVEYTNQHAGVIFAQVEGYKILIKFIGSLTGKIEVHPGLHQELKFEMRGMATFYKKQEIDFNPEKFKNYLF